jgi:hypothetical protein
MYTIDAQESIYILTLVHALEYKSTCKQFLEALKSRPQRKGLTLQQL